MLKKIVLITITLYLAVFCVNKSKGNLSSDRDVIFFKPFTTEYLNPNTAVLDTIATRFKKDPKNSIYLETMSCKEELVKNPYINFERVTKIKEYLKDKHGIIGSNIYFVDVSSETHTCDLALVNILICRTCY